MTAAPPSRPVAPRPRPRRFVSDSGPEDRRTPRQRLHHAMVGAAVFTVVTPAAYVWATEYVLWAAALWMLNVYWAFREWRGLRRKRSGGVGDVFR